MLTLNFNCQESNMVENFIFSRPESANALKSNFKNSEI